MTKSNIQFGLTLLSAALFLTACSDSGSDPETIVPTIEIQQEGVAKSSAPALETQHAAEPEVEVELHQLMFEAGRARIHADRLGYEWSVTKPLMDKGLAAFKAGDYEQARALYQEVKNQSLLAIEQSYYADIHWQLLIPIND
ncbi:MAG: hypothetical protein HRT93_09690 [Piscirickettsiaceae bacterium]|nr:hypothetical protein [Piscirickettsiaceae bacterium]